MAEADKWRFTEFLKVIIPIVATIIAAISLFFNITSRRKEITFAYLGKESVISVQPGEVHPDLKMEFRGETIRSLARMDFVLQNTGSLAVVAQEIREPLTLRFPTGVRLLKSVDGKTLPSDFTFRTSVGPGENQISFEFPLLNAGDEAYFSVYVYNSEPKLPELTGRIVDVHRISNRDESELRGHDPFPFVKARAGRKALYWAGIVANFLLAGLFAALLGDAIVDFTRYLTWKRKYQTEYDLIVSEVKSNPEPKDWHKRLDRLETVPSSVASDVGYEREYLLLDALGKKRIPPRPDAKKWGDFIALSLTALILLAIFGSAAVFMYKSPRGF